MKKMSICLWFDTQAEEAVNFYLSVFKDGKKGKVAQYGKEGFDIDGKPAGTIMTIEFEANGQHFIALNGGPDFKFNEAISLVIPCETQEEIDEYWNKLIEGGGHEIQCGWLKDKYGVCWQVVPEILGDMLSDSDLKKSQRVTRAFLQMKKFDIQKLKEVYSE